MGEECLVEWNVINKLFLGLTYLLGYTKFFLQELRSDLLGISLQNILASMFVPLFFKFIFQNFSAFLQCQPCLLDRQLTHLHVVNTYTRFHKTRSSQTIEHKLN